MIGPWSVVVEALDAACAVLVEALAAQSLYVAVTFGLALVASVLLRRSSGRVQAALWALVLVRLVLPPDLGAPWSARGLLAGVTADAAPRTERALGLPLLGDVGAATAAPEAAGGAAGRLPGSLLLVVAWLAGVALTAGRLGRDRRGFGRLLRRATPVDDPELLARLEALRRRMGVRSPVRLQAGGAGAPAFTLGVLRPVIHVPEGFLDPANRAALDAALAHELAHVRARDDLRLRLRAVVQALFFFHPVAWWAAARHAEARELAADERVVASGALSSRAYGRGFAAAVRLGSPNPRRSGTLSAPALATPRRRLVMRLERILDPRTSSAHRSPFPLAVLLAAGLLVLPMAGAAPASPASPDEPARGTASEPSHPETFTNPVPEARLTSSFGERWNPITRRRAHHRGIDLAAPVGTPVLAPAAGVVRVATERYAPAEHLGTVVVLDHGGGLETLYSHLDSLAVASGDRVTAGDPLGTVGATGDVTGPHVHFEVRQRGEVVDPASYLELAAARDE